jgi:hypothetical protein
MSFFMCAQAEEKKPLILGKKELISIRRGDSEFIFGGRTRIESYLEKNTDLLNSNIPDELEYIKHTSDLYFDYCFGEQKYGYEAVEAFATLSCKGAWGTALTYADRESGPIAPANVRIDSANLPEHSHTTGKLLVYFKEAWLQAYFNPIFNLHTKCLHWLKLGWFPFDLGRGIAFGSYYGKNKELLGLYSYVDDKSAPGILLSGHIIKDRLLYDIYYAAFENRSKSWSDEWNIGMRHVIGRESNPWIGEAKNDDVIAGRIKWRPFLGEKAGILDLEPYIFYNAASNQKIEIRPDAKTNFGSYGLNIEYNKGAFECGSDTAFNYGYERAFGIDRNVAIIANNEGTLIEQYSDLLYTNGGKKALVTTDSKKASQKAYEKDVNDNGMPIPGYPQFTNASDRFRPTYKTTLHGWMTVVDGAYTFKEHDLKVALSYAYASGDKAPHAGDNTDAHYHGFVGLHEGYFGRRVPSFIILDRRNLKRPTSLTSNGSEDVGVDTTFTDMQIVGLGATWFPNVGGKSLRINPNVLMFWKAFESRKWIIDPTVPDVFGRVSDTENASSFMGTEANVISNIELMPDLKLYLNFGIFVPGKYFNDVKGMPLDKDYYAKLVKDEGASFSADDAAHYRIWNDVAYDLNVGLDYKF